VFRYAIVGALVFIATSIQAGHFVVDVAAGCCVAIFAILFAKAVIARLALPGPMSARSRQVAAV
jgi:hypothetical protein